VTRALAAAVLCLTALLAPAGAAAQPDAQLRWPTLVPGELLLVRGTGVVPHLDSAIGLDLDLVRRPIVVTDPVVGVEREVIRHRLTTTLLYGVGLFDHSQVTVAVPLAFMSGRGRQAITRDTRDELPEGAAGDLRLGFHHALSPTWADLGALELAVSSGLAIPTGDEGAFAGHGGFTGWVETAALGRLPAGDLGSVRLQGALGTRVRGTDSLGATALGSELTLSAAAALELLDARLVVAAQGLGEVRAVLGESRAAELALGAGAGLNEALASPELQVIAQLRYVPRRARQTAP